MRKVTTISCLVQSLTGLDDDNLVSYAGMVPVLALAERAGLSELISDRVSINPSATRVRSAALNPAGKQPQLRPRWSGSTTWQEHCPIWFEAWTGESARFPAGTARF